MTDIQNNDPAEIEREIRETQDNMSSTIDKIGEQLSVRNVFNSLLDRADANNIDARKVLDGARRNPLALGLIAAGTIWLISEKDAKLPSFGGKSEGKSLGDHDDRSHENDYFNHMSSVEQNSNEDADAYQRRRDQARSNFFMVERSESEDEGSFRKRLDSVAETYRAKRDAFASNSANARDAAKERVSAAASRAKDAYESNPLVGGILAAAIGAAFGSTLPVTGQERRTLGSVGEKARDAIGKQAGEATATVRQKKDELLDKAEQALSSNAGNNAPEFDRKIEPEFAQTV